MNQFNVDFFDKNLNNVYHDTVDEPMVDDDYISADVSEIYVSRTSKIAKPGFIYITGDFEYFGLVTNVIDEEYLTRVEFRPIVNLFMQKVLFDTNLQNKTNNQNSQSLEKTIADIIKKYWQNTGDSEQNWPVFNVTNTDSVTNWGFNLKSDAENMHHCIIDFYETIIVESALKYSVMIKATPDFGAKKVNVAVRKNSSSSDLYLEVDRPWVTIETFNVNTLQDSANKLEIWNSSNYTDKINYYLYTDNSYSTSASVSGKTRVLPVVLDVVSVSPSTDKPFSDAAKEQADSAFSNLTQNSEIELYLTTKASPINLDDLKYGQTLNLIHNNTVYKAIFTGRVISPGVQKLVFGTVRTELTKQLKSSRG